MKKIKSLIFLILPCIFFILGLLVKSHVGYYHLFTSDPAYAYLFNGLALCDNNIPWLVQGPGTTLIVFCAIVIEIVHMFRGQDLMIDVMQNPDIYLDIINTSIIVIQSILLFLLGFLISKSSKNILTGLIFQLTPVVSWILIEILRLIMVENLIIIGVLGLILVVFYDTKQNNQRKLIDKNLILYSVIIGFISSSKLMFLPIAIIPFLLLDGYKKKLLYTLFSIISFFIFSFNVFNNWVFFRDFYINNFIYSGQYGTGLPTIIDLSTFSENIKYVFFSDGIYFKTFTIILAGVIFYHLPFLKIKTKNDKYYKALLGIFITMVVMSLLVAKQFKYYYMTSALLLIIPGLYYTFSIYLRKFSKKIRTIILIPSLLILIYFICLEILTIIKSHPYYTDKKEAYLNTMHWVNNNLDDNNPTLIIPNYYGTPYKEYGVFYGMAWSGDKVGRKFAIELNRLYPNIYIYHSWNNLFNQWDNSYSYIDLLKRYKKIVLFSGDAELEKLLQSKLNGLNRQYDTKSRIIKKFEITNETFYEVIYDSKKGTQLYNFLFDAENTDSLKYYFLSKEGIEVGNGCTQSSDYSRSGYYSSKLTKETPYGMTGNLSEVSSNEVFKISVWRYNNGNNNAGLVVSANDVNKYYSFNTNYTSDEDQWQKIEVEFVVPEIAHLQDIKIYCWNNDPDLPAYFDDLVIEKMLK